MIITIDGPSASGKSSLAQKLAQALKYIHINSGFLYRAAAVLYLRQTTASLGSAGSSPHNLGTLSSPQDVSKGGAVIAIDFLQTITKLKYIYNPVTNRAQVYYLDEDLTPALKTPQASQMASILSANPAVREIINQLQRDLITSNPQYGYIADGRDCGSVVFPRADLKIFLTASLQVRAERVCHDLQRLAQQNHAASKSVESLTLAECLAELAERDQRDQNRVVAPLIVPAGAIVIDSSDLALAQVVQKILALITKLSD